MGSQLQVDRAPSGPARRRVGWALVSGAGLVAIGGLLLLGAWQGRRPGEAAESSPSSRAVSTNTNQGKELAPVGGGTNSTKAPGDEVYRMEVAQAVMVTVELDFGSKVPTIAQALNDVERRYKPEDGKGRTFSVIDAYGAPTPTGKLHMSMHVSAEKPGGASLVFKRTGEILWRGQIVKGTNAATANFSNHGLVVLLDNGVGQTVTVDGSNNPRSILEARVKEMRASVSDIWPEGAEREVTFLYSACGCPVKVMAMRAGDKTVRTKDVPVIFPDDPAVVTVIKRIMLWD